MKLLLTIASGTLAGRIFELESGFLTIGRSENCSVRFDPVSERIASKQHAFIEAKADGYYLTDNESTNGTILNGERIQMSKIQSGDTNIYVEIKPLTPKLIAAAQIVGHETRRRKDNCQKQRDCAE